MNNIEEKALKILNILHEHNHESYIVGGYVRDKLLGKKSNDIDICTSATPKEIMELFPNTSSPHYGSINIIYKNSNFDITTFRKDIKYQDNRVPVKLKYIKNVKQDLLRRDFTINTICIDKDGNIIDLLNAKEDLDKKIITTVGNPRYRLKEDALRILRAIRFSTILDFEIDDKTKYYIKQYSNLLKKLSYTRKKQELDKIFTSKRKAKGIKLLIELNLTNDLEIENLKNITPCDDLIGIWTQANVDDIYPFSKTEKEQMKQIREFLELDIYDKYNIYKYGLYTATVAYQIKNMDISTLSEIYKTIPITSKKDINITTKDITTILNKEPGSYIKDIFKDLEKQIINGNLENNLEKITEYIENNTK